MNKEKIQLLAKLHREGKLNPEQTQRFVTGLKAYKEKVTPKYSQTPHPDMGTFNKDRYTLTNFLSNSGKVEDYRSKDNPHLRFSKNEDGQIFANTEGSNKFHSIDPDGSEGIDLGEVGDWGDDIAKTVSGIGGGILGALGGAAAGTATLPVVGTVGGAGVGAVAGNAAGESLFEGARQWAGGELGIPNNTENVGSDMAKDAALNMAIPVAGKYVGKAAKAAAPYFAKPVKALKDKLLDYQSKLIPDFNKYISDVDDDVIDAYSDSSSFRKGLRNIDAGTAKDTENLLTDKIAQAQKGVSNGRKEKLWKEGIEPHRKNMKPVNMTKVRGVYDDAIGELQNKFDTDSLIVQARKEADELRKAANTPDIAGMSNQGRKSLLKQADEIEEAAVKQVNGDQGWLDDIDLIKKQRAKALGSGNADMVDGDKAFGISKDLYGIGRANKDVMKSDAIQALTDQQKTDAALRARKAGAALKEALMDSVEDKEGYQQANDAYSTMMKSFDKTKTQTTQTLKNPKSLRSRLKEFTRPSDDEGVNMAQKAAFEDIEKYAELGGENLDFKGFDKVLRGAKQLGPNSAYADKIGSPIANKLANAVATGGFLLTRSFPATKTIGGVAKSVASKRGGGAAVRKSLDRLAAKQRNKSLYSKAIDKNFEKVGDNIDSIFNPFRDMNPALMPNTPNGIGGLMSTIPRKDRILYNLYNDDQ